jgi:hypothetical protein
VHPQPILDPVVTYETRPAAALQFLVNFGVFTGREATRLDIRKLSERLLELLPAVTARDCVTGFAGTELTESELAARDAVLEANAQPVWG